MARQPKPLAEALLFTFGVVAYSWLRQWPFAIVIPALLAAATVRAFRARGETLETFGLRPRRLARSLAVWRYWYLAGVAGVVAVLGERLLEPHLLKRGAVYFAWCVLQQLLYQNMVHKPVRRHYPHSGRAYWISGVLFASAHLPNPVLVPTTFAWGAISCRMFERLPSVLGLALIQILFSSVLYWATPFDWHRGFRVGIGYFLVPAPLGHNSAINLK